MNRVTILSFFALTASIGCLLATTAHSQIGAPKSAVVLQPTTPGTSQSGHANISGTMRAGQFVGGGSGLTSLSSANLVGAIPDTLISANFARRDQNNDFAGPINQFSGFVGVKRNFQVTSQESFGVGNSSNGFDGMYVRTSAIGLPFYGYSQGGAVSAFHYLDSFDGNKWKLFQGGAVRLTVDTAGKFGVNNSNPDAQFDVVSAGKAASFVGNPNLLPAVQIVNTNASGMGLFVKASGDGEFSGGAIKVENSSPNISGMGIFATGLPGVGGATINSNRAFPANTYSVYFSSAISAVNAEAVTGTFGNGNGIGCETADSNGKAIFARAAGLGANVAVYSDGNFVATGTKSFEIDHPLDPEHKTLKHYCSEGPEPYNVYRGNVTLDGTGSAWVELPRYFDAINTDLSYQLTCVGGYAQVYVAEEVSDNRFKISGGRPGLKVSWQVTGVRNDAYVRHHGFQAEADKPASQQGFYLSPESYGLPRSRGFSETMKATKNSDGSVVIAGKYYSPSEAKRLKL